MGELTQVIAKGGELFVLGFAELSGGARFRTGGHKDGKHKPANC
jgi:hypothetical protein